MLNVLLESRAPRERRRGGTIVSVALHGCLVGAALAATVREAMPERPPRTPRLVFVPLERAHPTATPEIARASVGQRRGAATRAIVPPTAAIQAIDFGRIPTTLPDGPLSRIDLGDDARAPVTALGGDALRGGASGPALDAVHRPEQVERLATLRSAPSPRYPERLRAAGVSGRVVVRFVVDTTGRIEAASEQVVSSDHPELTAAVRAVLPRLRFVPAESGGRPVRMLVELPFEFALR